MRHIVAQMKANNSPVCLSRPGRLNLPAFRGIIELYNLIKSVFKHEIRVQINTKHTDFKTAAESLTTSF